MTFAPTVHGNTCRGGGPVVRAEPRAGDFVRNGFLNSCIKKIQRRKRRTERRNCCREKKPEGPKKGDGVKKEAGRRPPNGGECRSPNRGDKDLGKKKLKNRRQRSATARRGSKSGIRHKGCPKSPPIERTRPDAQLYRRGVRTGGRRDLRKKSLKEGKKNIDKPPKSKKSVSPGPNLPLFTEKTSPWGLPANAKLKLDKEV